jgi:hypothetical protein
MGHVNSVQIAISKTPNPTVFQKTLSINDFYFGSEDWPYPMGHISFVGKLDGETLKGGAPPLTPGFTLDMMAVHSLDFWLTSEDLPDPDTRVTLDRDGNIVLSYKPNNEDAQKRLIAQLHKLMGAHRGYQTGLFARSLYVGQRIPWAGVAHQNGTVRFGRDPKTSALDANCKAHDLDNLYVVDASFFCFVRRRESRINSDGERPASGRPARESHRAGAPGSWTMVDFLRTSFWRYKARKVFGHWEIAPRSRTRRLDTLTRSGRSMRYGRGKWLLIMFVPRSAEAIRSRLYSPRWACLRPSEDEAEWRI